MQIKTYKNIEFNYIAQNFKIWNSTKHSERLSLKVYSQNFSILNNYV